MTFLFRARLKCYLSRGLETNRSRLVFPSILLWEFTPIATFYRCYCSVVKLTRVSRLTSPC
ncbi:hypothetical protein PITC_009310 [Penicillium italicum]|uniref:Uncharacterized protein n=1 Tax=Penicillium italicum TaxID=40296 RepID=A0A0A2KT08_PENIT|nr:hypothetical protein PITC_009310 [Penicillium italicum]